MGKLNENDIFIKFAIFGEVPVTAANLLKDSIDHTIIPSTNWVSAGIYLECQLRYRAFKKNP